MRLKSFISQAVLSITLWNQISSQSKIKEFSLRTCDEIVFDQGIIRNPLIFYTHFFKSMFCVSDNNSPYRVNRVELLSEEQAREKSNAFTQDFFRKNQAATEARNQAAAQAALAQPGGAETKIMEIKRAGQTAFTSLVLPIGEGSLLIETPIQAMTQYMEMKSHKKFNSIAQFCAAGTLADPLYFQGSNLNSAVYINSTTDLPITIQYHLIDANGQYAGLQTAAPAAISFNAATSVCTNFVASIQLSYKVANTSVIQDAVMRVYYRASLTFTSPWQKFVFSVIPEPVDLGGRRMVLVRPGLGYKFGDYVPFGTWLSSADLDFTGVRTEVPVSSFRFKDYQGRCLLYDAARPFFSEDSEVLRLGQSKLRSCKVVLNSANEMSNFCNKLSIQSVHLYLTAVPKYGVGNLDFRDDWVLSSPSPLSTSQDSVGQCTFVLPALNIIYSKVGVQKNFRYRINQMTYTFKSKILRYDTTVGGTQTFNIEFLLDWIEAPPVEGQYQAPLPSIEFVYLPNDILYPFFVAN